MKKTILLAAMFATVASFADGNYVKFSTNVEKNFDTTYKRAEADAGDINKGQALTTKANGSEKAAYDIAANDNSKTQKENADKSVKFNDDANLEFGPEIQLTLGNSGFSFGGKLMNKTTFNSFDLSRLTLADGNSEAWGMFTLPKETAKNLSSSVKFTIKTSKDTKNPELGLYENDTKLDAKLNDETAKKVYDIVNGDQKENIKYVSYKDNTIKDFTTNPNDSSDAEKKATAEAYKTYTDDKSVSVKTEGTLDTTLDYALETKDLKSANIGLNTSTSFEFKKDTDFATKYTAYADLKGKVNAYRTELETENNYKDSRFKGFKYIQSNSDLKLGITDISFLSYLSLDKLNDTLTKAEKLEYIAKTAIINKFGTPEEKQNLDKRYEKANEYMRDFIAELGDSYLDANKKDVKKIKETYDKSLNTEEEKADKDAEKAVKDAKKDLISEKVKKDDSLTYNKIEFKVGGEPVEGLNLGLNLGLYNSNLSELGIEYSKNAKNSTEIYNDVPEIKNVPAIKYLKTNIKSNLGSKLGAFIEYTMFGFKAKLSNDLEFYSGTNLKYLLSSKSFDFDGDLELGLQEKPALNLEYTYNYKDMFALENKLGLSGIFNVLGKINKVGDNYNFESEKNSILFSIDPEIKATVKPTDKLSFNVGTKLGFDILINKVDMQKNETAADTEKQKEKKFVTNFRTEVMPSVGVVFKATDKLTLDSTTSLDLNLVNRRILKSAVKFGGSLKYEW